MLKTSSKSCLQASQFALIKLLFAYFKQPKQIFLLKMEPSLDLYFAFFKQFNLNGVQESTDIKQDQKYQRIEEIHQMI